MTKTGIITVLFLATACATTGPRAGKLDLAIVDAHLRSDALCSAAVGAMLGKAGVQAALASVGLPPATVNAGSAVLAKLSGAMDADATAETTLSLAETCATLAQNIRDDVTGGRALVERIKANIKAKRGK